MDNYSLDFEAAEKASAPFELHDSRGWIPKDERKYRDTLNTQHRAALARVREEHQGRIKAARDGIAEATLLLDRQKPLEAYQLLCDTRAQLEVR